MLHFTRNVSRRHVLQIVAAQPVMMALADLSFAANAPTMRAMRIDKYGPPEAFYSAEVERPNPGPGEVLIEIKAVGTNPADTYMRYGKYRERKNARPEAPFPRVVGLDAAGIVIAVGQGVTEFRRDDRVAARTKTGSYASHAIAVVNDCAKLPEGMTFDVAAALPCAGLTGVQLIDEGLPQLKAGQKVMVTGATGSVGRFALYAARAKGAHVVAAVRTAYMDEARALGANTVISTDAELPADFRVDHVADTIGGKVAARLCQAVVANGSIVTSNTAPSGDAGIDPSGLPVKPRHYTYTHDGKRLAKLFDAVMQGKVSMPIAQRLALTDAAEAHRLLEKGGNQGKIILIP